MSEHFDCNGPVELTRNEILKMGKKKHPKIQEFENLDADAENYHPEDRSG